MTDGLKTLKDIYDKEDGFLTFEERELGMNTVKNAPVIVGYDKQIRQEAIKWIKSIRSGEHSCTIKGGDWGAVEVLKAFFNISEEDLK